MVRSIFNTLAFAIVLAFPLISNAAPVKEMSLTRTSSAESKGSSMTGDDDNMNSEDEQNQAEPGSFESILGFDYNSLPDTLEEVPVVDRLVYDLPAAGHAEFIEGNGDLIEDTGLILQESEHIVQATVLATVDILKAILAPVFDE